MHYSTRISKNASKNTSEEQKEKLKTTTENNSGFKYQNTTSLLIILEDYSSTSTTRNGTESNNCINANSPIHQNKVPEKSKTRFKKGTTSFDSLQSLLPNSKRKKDTELNTLDNMSDSKRRHVDIPLIDIATENMQTTAAVNLSNPYIFELLQRIMQINVQSTNELMHFSNETATPQTRAEGAVNDRPRYDVASLNSKVLKTYSLKSKSPQKSENNLDVIDHKRKLITPFHEVNQTDKKFKKVRRNIDFESPMNASQEVDVPYYCTWAGCRNECMTSDYEDNLDKIPMAYMNYTKRNSKTNIEVPLIIKKSNIMLPKEFGGEQGFQFEKYHSFKSNARIIINDDHFVVVNQYVGNGTFGYVLQSKTSTLSNDTIVLKIDHKKCYCIWEAEIHSRVRKCFSFNFIFMYP